MSAPLPVTVDELHGLEVVEVDALLTDIAQHAIVLTPVPSSAAAPALGDQFLWELLAVQKRFAASHWRQAAAARRRHAGSGHFTGRILRRMGAHKISAIAARASFSGTALR